MPVPAMIDFDRQFLSVLARWLHKPRVAGGRALDQKAVLLDTNLVANELVCNSILIAINSITSITTSTITP